MPRPPQKKENKPVVESLEALVTLLSGFDYAVDSDDFVLYELNRLIDEERASFDDPEFRQLIDEGIRAHIEENLEIRAQLAGKLRAALTAMDSNRSRVALRVIHALEDLNSDLRNAGVLTRSYTSYLLKKLEAVASEETTQDEAAALIDRWRNGEILREELVAGLRRIGAPAIGPAADLLFESSEDRMAAEAAIAVLSQIRSATSARVLAHVVAEPLLDEDLESTAFSALKTCWPLPRPFILYNLRRHAHEDIPFQWFRLLVEVDEPATVDMALEELRAHGDKENYREDLVALLDVLQGSRDPETEDKILGAMNSPAAQPEVLPLLEKFLQEYRKPGIIPETWVREATALELNEKFVGAAKLFDAGKRDEARKALDQVLSVDPNYPFARNLPQ